MPGPQLAVKPWSCCAGVEGEAQVLFPKERELAEKCNKHLKVIMDKGSPICEYHS